MFGDTFGKDEDFGKSAPFYFCLNMKKLFTLIFACFISFNAIQAEITWNLSDDGTLTISGTDMPNYGGTAPWYSQRDKIKQIIIKNGVTNIGSYAFNGCSVLTSLTIPNSVTSIGSKALDGTKWYDNQPNGVVYAGKVLYKYKGTMPSNTKIDIKEGTTGIAASAFNGCSSLTSLTIPNSVTNIGGSAFYKCGRLTSIIIPNSVTSIGDYAFYCCSGLTSVTIPNSVTSIGNNAFRNCSGLTSLTIGMKHIGDAFRGFGLTNVTILDGVESIGTSAFSDCLGLTTITIPNSVTSIGESAFSRTKWYDNQPDGLVYAGKVLYKYKGTMPYNTKIDIKDGTKAIVERAFVNCTYLISVTIPNSVTSIGSYAFQGCSGLTSVTIGNSVESIGDYAFNNCTSLTSVYITDLVSWCKIKFGSGYANPLCYAEHLYLNKKIIFNLIIPNGVTSIEPGHFFNCKYIFSVEIPESVTSIGASAFSGCSGLTSLTIPESVTSIGGGAFDGAKLRNIVIKAKTPPSGGSAFSGQSYYHTTLLVPEGSWDAYAYSDNWYQFINIREVAYNAVNLTNSKAYMLKSSNEGSYLFYDSVNDCVASLNETALDDTEENNTWMTTEVDGKHYVYNLGAKKFLVADKTNAKTGYRLSDVPVSIDIEDGKDAIVFGKSKEFYMVINDKLNVDENLESQIIATTGIKGISVGANQPTVTYSVNGQVVPNDTKGLHIKNGKKVIVK